MFVTTHDILTHFNKEHNTPCICLILYRICFFYYFNQGAWRRRRRHITVVPQPSVSSFENVTAAAALEGFRRNKIRLPRRREAGFAGVLVGVI
jgi:hypothetical protein